MVRDAGRWDQPEANGEAGSSGGAATATTATAASARSRGPTKLAAVVVVFALLGACAVEGEAVQEELVQEDANVKSRPTAEQVCAKLDQDRLASQDDRLPYLKKIRPEAGGVGFGLGPALVVTIKALKKGDNDAAAEGFDRIQRSCKLATG